MNDDQEFLRYGARTNALKTLAGKVYMHRLPSYGNKIFYGLGFLALTCIVLLAASGMLMAFMGQAWWLGSSWGVFTRSVHLWSVQFFIAILILHILVGFTTSGFKPPRRMVWVFGAIIFCLSLIQTEFGYGLRGDFSSQFRAVSGADFWNGAYLGYWLNPLNHLQEYALHTTIIPFAILLLFIAHYVLVRTYGIAKPYRSDVTYTMADANHTVMYARGALLVAAVLVLAYLFPSPYVPAVRIADLARQNPALVTTTLLNEFDHTSDTATYLDSIDPYTFDTREVFFVAPYELYTASGSGADAWAAFQSETPEVQQADLAAARQYAEGSTTSLSNPLIVMLDTLAPMAKSGLYESMLNQESPSTNETYTLRFLSDMDALETKAGALNMNTAEWGMIKDETGSLAKLPPGSWWFLPIGMLNSSFDLLDNPNGDRIAAELLGLIMLLFITFPYIPYVNRLPELLHLAPFIWREREKR
ncbi:MAG: cytochrome b N-terminal domain-containing protein [Patescibacteria group bacterium]|nr:cytochrome b N-terminal domain-containing protein [Patescibacteria group bacterium]